MTEQATQSVTGDAGYPYPEFFLDDLGQPELEGFANIEGKPVVQLTYRSADDAYRSMIALSRLLRGRAVWDPAPVPGDAEDLAGQGEPVTDITLIRQAAAAGRFRIRREERSEGADPDAGMVWPIEIELPCINDLSCWFPIGNLYTPDAATRGYTDGALSDDLAQAFANHIERSLSSDLTKQCINSSAPSDPIYECLTCHAVLQGRSGSCPICGLNEFKPLAPVAKAGGPDGRPD